MIDNLSYINGGTVDYSENNPSMVHQIFKELYEESDENDGITFYNGSGTSVYYSYRDMAIRSYNRLKLLRSQGLKVKDKLVFQCSTGKDFIELFWACMFGGIVPVPLNMIYDYNPFSQEVIMLQNILKMLDYPKIAVSQNELIDYRGMFKKIGLDSNLLIEIEEFKGPLETVENFIPNDNGLTSDDLAIMFFTSGSTGVPKGVMQSNRAMVSREMGVQRLNNFKKDVSLNWMPLEHAGGILMAHFRSIYLKSNQIIVDKEYILQNPLIWLDLMSKHKVVYSWAPHFAFELINRELENGATGDWDLSSVEFLLNGGEMVNCIGAKKFLKLLKPYKLCNTAMHPAWGMCETCSGVLYNNDLDSSDYSGIQVIKKSSDINIEFGKIEDADIRCVMSIGKPIPGIEIRITDSHDNIIPQDTIGRFQIKGSPVTMGYFENDEVNAESFTDDGWFNTGDLGFIHDENMILTGREKDTIIINGLNYNNAEIESIIETLPYIEKSFTAVCAVNKDNDTKDSVVAFFVVKEGVNPYFARQKVLDVVKSKMHLSLDDAIMVNKEDIPKSNLEKIQRKKIASIYNSGGFDSITKSIKEYLSLKKNHRVPDWFLVQRFEENFTESIAEDVQNICAVGDISFYKNLQKNLIEKFMNIKIYSASEDVPSETFDVILYIGNFESLQVLAKQIARGDIQAKRIYIITEKLYKILDSDECNYNNGAVIGFIKCLGAELGNTSICNIDVQSIDTDTEFIIKELKSRITDIQIAYRNSNKYTVRLEYPNFTGNENGFSYGALYLITGGLGGVGRSLAEFLLKYYSASVILIGRTDLNGNVEKLNKFKRLKSISENVYYETADVSDLYAVTYIVNKYEKQIGKKLSKIIHTAGLGNLTEHWACSDERLIKNADEKFYKNMFKAKIIGTLNLYSITNKIKNAQLILCGSTNGFFGSTTFAGYSAANSFLDYFSQAINDSDKVKCLNFSTWNNLGMSENNPFGRIGAKKGFYEMDTITGIFSIEKSMQFDNSSIFVGLDTTKAYIRGYLAEGIIFHQCESEQVSVKDSDEAFTDIEVMLLDIWKKLLGVSVISRNDDFFEMGGNSLKAINLVSEVKSVYNINFSLRDIFQYSSFGEMLKSILSK